MVHLPYEAINPIDSQSPITHDLLHKISRNQDFVNQLKLEGRVRNINPNTGDARRSPSPPFKMDDLAILSERIPVTARLDNLSPNRLRISVSYTLPSNSNGNYFSSKYLPVANVSISGAKAARKVAVIIRSISDTSIKLVVQSFNTEFEPGVDNFIINLFMISVKGPMLGG
jgi:hypothetical protein